LLLKLHRCAWRPARGADQNSASSGSSGVPKRTGVAGLFVDAFFPAKHDDTKKQRG
jgi:hypothetical protein